MVVILGVAEAKFTAINLLLGALHFIFAVKKHGFRLQLKDPVPKLEFKVFKFVMILSEELTTFSIVEVAGFDPECIPGSYANQINKWIMMKFLCHYMDHVFEENRG